MTETPHIGLHIGLPKTATTSLQELVFAHHPEMAYYGQSNLWQDSGAKAVLRALLLPDAPEEPARDAIRAGLDRTGTVMISDEALTLGEFMLRATRWPVTSDPEWLAQRARAVLGDAAIFLVLRNQPAWLESWHRQGLKQGKYAETDPERWLQRDLADGGERLLALLDYDRLYRAWVDAFGAERVHVYLYEHYSDRLPDLAAAMAGALGVNADTARDLAGAGARNISGSRFQGLPPAVQHAVRAAPVRPLLERLPAGFRRRLRRLLERERAYQGMGDAQATRLRQHFAESNAALMERLDIAADGMGYW